MSLGVGAGALPTTVRIAAALLVALGLFTAVVFQDSAGWRDWRAVPHALLRLFPLALIAWGLLRRARWAWWLAVGLASLLGTLGLIALTKFAFVGPAAREFTIIAGISGSGMAAAVVLLLTRSARTAFARPGADASGANPSGG